MTKAELAAAHETVIAEWRRLNPIPNFAGGDSRPWAHLDTGKGWRLGYDVWFYDNAGGSLFKDRRIAHVTHDLHMVYWYGPPVWQPMFARPFTGKGWLMKMIEALSLAANTCLAEEIAKAKERA
jgi:hypothetical protein